jgi:hypothetical protein
MDMWQAAWPQLVAYISLNGFFTLLFPTQIVLPVEAPTLLRFVGELAACIVIGDFNIYWMHVGMHAIPFLR